MGKLYQIKRTESEKGWPFRAGNLGKSYPTASGGWDYEILFIEDRSFLMFLGIKTEPYPINKENVCYIFLYNESLVIFKKSDIQKQNCFHKVSG